MLSLDADVDASLVMSPRGGHKSFICVKSETGDIVVQELSTSGFDCSSCEKCLCCVLSSSSFLSKGRKADPCLDQQCCTVMQNYLQRCF